MIQRTVFVVEVDYNVVVVVVVVVVSLHGFFNQILVAVEVDIFVMYIVMHVLYSVCCIAFYSVLYI